MGNFPLRLRLRTLSMIARIFALASSDGIRVCMVFRQEGRLLDSDADARARAVVPAA